MPRISIIIPIRNEEKRLSYCLPSLLNQTYQDFEVILVEDPETSDKTKEFVESLQSEKIQYVLHSKGMKLAEKRDFGTKSANGDYYYFADADMEFPSDILNEINNIIESKKSDIVFVSEQTPGKTWANKMKNMEKNIASSYFELSAARVFSKKLYNEIGGYDKDLNSGGEDGDISDRAMLKSSNYSQTIGKIKHYDSVGIKFTDQIYKKFKYGTSAVIYFQKQAAYNSDLKKVNKNSRAKSSLAIYFLSPEVWKNPLLGIQFVFYKLIELTALAFGYLYGYFVKVYNNSR